MYLPLNCIVVDQDQINRREMGQFLSGQGASVAGSFGSLDQLAAALADPCDAQVVLVTLDPRPQEALVPLSQMVARHPAITFLALSQQVEAALLMEVMRAGIKEFMPLPVEPARLLATLERLASRTGAPRAKMINVIPAAGGCGATTIACNLAAALSESARTVLVDLDLVGGTVASSFDLRPRYTIADLMDQSQTLDKRLLDNALSLYGKEASAGSGLFVLSRPQTLEEAGSVTQSGLSRLLNTLGRLFDYVVLDSVLSADAVYTAALAAADVNLLVMQLDIPSARNAERLLKTVRRMRLDVQSIKLVANRVLKKGHASCQIEPQEVERALEMEILLQLPNDFKNAIEAINFGQPVVLRAPRSPLAGSLRSLRDRLTAAAPAVRSAADAAAHAAASEITAHTKPTRNETDAVSWAGAGYAYPRSA